MTFSFNPAEAELNFAAAMTNRQFAALRARLNKFNLVEELKKLPTVRKLKPAANFDEREARKWLTNGWNTEYLLRTTRDVLPGDQLVNAVQWSFPQAYYSTFAITLGFFKTVGHTEYSHTAVIRKFGELVGSGVYPSLLSFTAHGGKPITFSGVKKCSMPSTLAFSATDAQSVENQICQFLSGTRQRDLAERRKSIKFVTKKGARKKSLTTAEWNQVSNALGPTSLLSLLYRKRIKSNYQDIDTFLSADLEAEALFDDLIHVVSCLNLVHETFIGSAVGVSALEGMATALRDGPVEFVERRLKLIREVAAAQV